MSSLHRQRQHDVPTHKIDKEAKDERGVNRERTQVNDPS